MAHNVQPVQAVGLCEIELDEVPRGRQKTARPVAAAGLFDVRLVEVVDNAGDVLDLGRTTSSQHRVVDQELGGRGESLELKVGGVPMKKVDCRTRMAAAIDVAGGKARRCADANHDVYEQREAGRGGAWCRHAGAERQLRERRRSDSRGRWLRGAGTEGGAAV